ncbi:hypothetical protein lerEdw1_005417 [Lerista edwardsae]|nr:hypothetical protein lerEdw1_005417 [Lerista edwardsae]
MQPELPEKYGSSPVSYVTLGLQGAQFGSHWPCGILHVLKVQFTNQSASHWYQLYLIKKNMLGQTTH